MTPEIRTIILFMLLAPAGCAVKPSNENVIGLGTGSSNEAVRNRLTNTSNGLAIHRWTIIDAPGRAIQALLKHNNGQPLDDAAQVRLKRNGFRFVRVPMDHLESLLADLGGATVDANEWHGQVYEWRSIQDRPIDSRGLAVAIDGQIERYDHGEFRLMMRSWSVQMEDGPCVHLEMLPVTERPRANDLRRLLGEETNGGGIGGSGTGFNTMAIDLQLEAGWAYVLLSESPQVDWVGLDAQVLPRRGSPANAAKAIVHPLRSSSRMGPTDLGPGAIGPQTLGELLLPIDRDPPARNVLVFVPKISADLFPASQVVVKVGGG